MIPKVTGPQVNQQFIEITSCGEVAVSPVSAAAPAHVFAAIAGFVAGASARPAASWFGQHLNVPSADVPDPVFAEVSAAAVLAWRRVFPAAVDIFGSQAGRGAAWAEGPWDVLQWRVRFLRAAACLGD